ncbi:methylmalonyl-CoA epimerase [Heterostelium album PN500]|uniref:Methylmalonyl-CoA epimerase, mitochondrial n=1 Tax=Heterostelium pallidum (strain ATCC 26659 / Pp 5 / PN500) TaxID=670386 RepID=D3B4P2_HETP5|nr:methylmalonyl-CoA epimerase [Heterostelium album PN500]EFA84290.1 methylmalonyl-CoA epimerase [Heterostelium album PN500]|eukprot:XP_020436406.1 methylmalonyl-CoA epimerase [Heterostelium album PN500]
MFRFGSRLLYSAAGSGGFAGAKGIVGTVGLGRLNHVAIAVPNMEEAATMYRDVMGCKVSEAVEQKEHGVSTVFVALENTKIELLHPLGENSPIANFLKKNPAGGIHHVCIEVDDIHSAVKVLQEKQIRIIDPNPKIGAHGKPVVFLHPKSCNGVLVELEEK